MLLAIIFVGTFGKFVGAGVAAHFTGLKLKDSVIVGMLMNTRGIFELILLNFGLKSNILNICTYTCIVTMSLFTTILTAIVVKWIHPNVIRADCLGQFRK